MEDVKSSTRSYGHYCGLARALDLIGDRWSLLVVRELLPGPMRYGELLSSLNGIATNLLAGRLRRLEAAGIIERRLGETTGVEYALTSWGAELREAVEALVRWSTPVMMTGPAPDDAFEPRWLAVALPGLLADKRSGKDTELGIDVSGDVMSLHIDENGPRVEIHPAERPPTVVQTSSPALILGIAAGVLDIEDVGSELEVDGNPKVVAEVLSAPSA